MPFIRRRRIPLPLEHMPQMPPALRARNLRAVHAQRAVRVPLHRAGDAVEVGGPAAAGFEFVGCGVEGCGASCACLYQKKNISGDSFSCFIERWSLT